MENLFGKVLPEYKIEENLKTIFSEESFNSLKQEAEKLINEGKNPDHKEVDGSITEKIANTVFNGMEKLGFFNNLFVYSDDDLKKAFKFDLKLLIILAFYFDQISINAKLVNDSFPENTPYVGAFKENFTFKSKKQEIFKINNNHYPLEHFFFPNGRTGDSKKEPIQIHNFIDMALSMCLLGSSSSTVNIYLNDGFAKTINVFKFLQLFKYAYIDTGSINKLLDKLRRIKPTTSTADYKGDKPYTEKNRMTKQWINDNRPYFSPEGYALLNQFCIERLTNLNYIVSLYDHKKNSFNLFDYSKYGQLLTYWLMVPLFKTRLSILRYLKKYDGKLINTFNQSSDEKTAQFYDDSRHILEEIIPIACGMYSYLMNSCKYRISKDDKYFTALYVDPKKTTDDPEAKYMLFTLNSSGAIVPAEKFCFHKETILNAVLDANIKESGYTINIHKTDNIQNRFYSIFYLYKSEYDRVIDKELRQKRCKLYYSIQDIEHRLNSAKSGKQSPVIKVRSALGEYPINNNLNNDEVKELELELKRLKKNLVNLEEKIEKYKTGTILFSIERIFKKFNIEINPDKNESVEYANISMIPSPCYKCSLEDSLFAKKGLLHIEFANFLKNMALYFDNESEESFKNISYLPTRDRLYHILQDISESNYARIINPKILSCFKELESVYNNICVEEYHTLRETE